jgi:hypothetical protein
VEADGDLHALLGGQEDVLDRLAAGQDAGVLPRELPATAREPEPDLTPLLVGDRRLVGWDEEAVDGHVFAVAGELDVIVPEQLDADLVAQVVEQVPALLAVDHGFTSSSTRLSFRQPRRSASHARHGRTARDGRTSATASSTPPLSRRRSADAGSSSSSREGATGSGSCRAPQARG